ncbi:ATP-binding protein, partial [Streptomyces sp. 4F14]|uniref:ATP-binding protein n=1 Tax=Streptomyces sp. 4F14 TaxID=3394380 RepID=UPI003A8C128D
VEHLLAELIENGAECSHPDRMVTVQSKPVKAGLVVEIEDRGLGQPADQLERYNRMLAQPREEHLAEQLHARQLGLLVVAKLAKRYGIRVELRENIFQGTTALVVVPNKLLLPPAESPKALSAATGRHPVSV